MSWVDLEMLADAAAARQDECEDAAEDAAQQEAWDAYAAAYRARFPQVPTGLPTPDAAA